MAKERPDRSRSARKRLRPKRRLEGGRTQGNGAVHLFAEFSSRVNACAARAEGTARRAVVAKECGDGSREFL